MSDAKSLFQAVESESTSAVSDILHELSERPETSLRSAVNQRNEQNQTVLHVACVKLHADISQILLEVGADPNAQDVEGRTPTYSVVAKLQDCNCEECNKKAIRCLTVLSYHGGSMDIPNGSGVAPLFLCAEYRFAECAKALLQNGAALGTAKGKPMIEILVEKIPAVLETVFDRAVKVKGSKQINDPEFELTCDLGVILPPQITLSGHFHNGTTSMNQVFPAEKWLKDKYEPCEEMVFLRRLLSHTENDVTTYRNLLRHPLVNVFTDMKWRSLQAIYMFFLVMQVKVLVAYSAFICATIFLDCPYNLYLSVQKGIDKIHTKAFPNSGDSHFNASDIINPEELCRIGFSSKMLSIFVMMCTLCILIKELQHAMYDLKEYLRDVFNYFQLIGFCSVIYTVIIAWDPTSHLYAYLYPAAAFGVTVSWCQLFVQIGRLPQLAIYVEMFVKITVNFLWSLGVYSTVLIGFAISFSILFPTKPKLIDIPLSMVQVLIMMIGELNYNDLFNEDYLNAGDEESSASNVTNSKYSLQHRFSGHVWLSTFIILITLVLMNLLVGLAVSDIQGIKKHAETFVIRRRIRYLAFLEKSLFEATTMFPQCAKKFLRENVAIAKSSDSKKFLCCFAFMCTPVELKNCKLTIHPNKREEKLLTSESKQSIKHWFLSKAASTLPRKCVGNRGASGFRQRPARRGSTASFVGQQIFVRDNASQNDSDRLKRLEFNVQQMEKKMNELDLKIDMILKSVQRPADAPDVY